MKKIINIRKFKLFCSFVIFANVCLNAQNSDSLKISVKLQINKGIVTINYDLNGPRDIEYNVDLTLKKEKDKSFMHIPGDISGDKGKGYYAGKNRKIIWNYSKEFPSGIEDAYFELTATMIPKPVETVEKGVKESGSNLLYYIGGGAALIGGGVAILLSGSKTTTTTIMELPDAPKLR